MKVKKTCNRLYKIIIEDGRDACLLSKTEENSWLWHLRLGHVNFQTMSLMSRNKMVQGLPDLVCPKETCNGCLLSKQARRPFPSKAGFAATRCLELIHGDICGPISPTTPAGNRYFLLLVDDFSRAMWVFMIKTKDEALSIFKKFKALVENESKEVIQVLRTDRGANFVRRNSQNFVRTLE